MHYHYLLRKSWEWRSSLEHDWNVLQRDNMTPKLSSVLCIQYHDLTGCSSSVNKECRTASILRVEKANWVGATLRNIGTPVLVSALRVSEWEPNCLRRYPFGAVRHIYRENRGNSPFRNVAGYLPQNNSSFMVAEININFFAFCENRICWSLLSECGDALFNVPVRTQISLVWTTQMAIIKRSPLRLASVSCLRDCDNCQVAATLKYMLPPPATT